MRWLDACAASCGSSPCVTVPGFARRDESLYLKMHQRRERTALAATLPLFMRQQREQLLARVSLRLRAPTGQPKMQSFMHFLDGL